MGYASPGADFIKGVGQNGDDFVIIADQNKSSTHAAWSPSRFHGRQLNRQLTKER